MKFRSQCIRTSSAIYRIIKMSIFIKIKDLYVDAYEVTSFRIKSNIICPTMGPAIESFTIRFFLKNGRDMESKSMTLEEKTLIELKIGQDLNVQSWLGKLPIFIPEKISENKKQDERPGSLRVPDY